MVKLVSLIGLIVLLTLGITKPFIGHHDWNGVFYSSIARNYLKYGIETKLGQMTGPGSFYTHYPPLFTWLLAADFKLLGVNDITARLLPLTLTILSFILLIKITDSVIPLLLGLTPMIRYFSHMPSQEALMIFLAILTVYWYKKRNSKAIFITAATLGWSGWAGYFLLPLLWLHAYLLTGSLIGGGIFDALLLRLNLYPALGRLEPELAGQFSLIAYIVKEFSTLNIYYTSTVLLLSGLGVLQLIRKAIKRQKITAGEGLILIMLAWGAA